MPQPRPSTGGIGEDARMGRRRAERTRTGGEGRASARGLGEVKRSMR